MTMPSLWIKYYYDCGFYSWQPMIRSKVIVVLSVAYTSTIEPQQLKAKITQLSLTMDHPYFGVRMEEVKIIDLFQEYPTPSMDDSTTKLH